MYCSGPLDWWLNLWWWYFVFIPAERSYLEELFILLSVCSWEVFGFSCLRSSLYSLFRICMSWSKLLVLILYLYDSSIEGFRVLCQLFDLVQLRCVFFCLRVWVLVAASISISWCFKHSLWIWLFLLPLWFLAHWIQYLIFHMLLRSHYWWLKVGHRSLLSLWHLFSINPLQVLLSHIII